MADEITEDVVMFGRDAWVYCAQHLRPHTTGWCTVHSDQKTLLDATSSKGAYAECARRGFRLFDPHAQHRPKAVNP
jgi:hypothetical protein